MALCVTIAYLNVYLVFFPCKFYLDISIAASAIHCGVLLTFYVGCVFSRQKQQILQLHARIRENELKAQQVLQSQKGRCDDPYLLNAKVIKPHLVYQ